jgi:hypothetical protein
MKRSAMLQAFRALGKKPMIFLLVLPIALVGLLSVLLMPDMTKLMDMNNILNNSDAMFSQTMAANIVSLTANSLASVLAIACFFLLLPPAVELLRDGAAGAETQRGWYLRGLVNHWWKPVTTSAITGAAYFIASLPVMIAMVVGLVMNTITRTVDMFAMPDFTSPNDTVNNMMGTLMPAILKQIGIYVAIIGVVALVVYSILGMMLPALADRKFGAAFKLMFSKKGFRNLPRMAGGLATLYIVPMVACFGLGALYLLPTGLPKDYLGWMTALFGFIKSWEYILAMVIAALCIVLEYAFKFCVYQQTKEEEIAAAAPQQL